MTSGPADIGSRAILGVEPFPVAHPGSRSTWRCTRCARNFPVADSYAVRFDSLGRTLTFVVCPDCARLYDVPRPVVLDLERLPTPDRADRELSTVTAHVWRVSNLRSPPPRRALTLRDADVRTLAADRDETPADLVETLGRRDLLVQ